MYIYIYIFTYLFTCNAYIHWELWVITLRNEVLAFRIVVTKANTSWSIWLIDMWTFWVGGEGSCCLGF